MSEVTLENLKRGTKEDNYILDGEEENILRGRGVVNIPVIEEYVDQGKVKKEDHPDYPIALYKYRRNYNFSPVTRLTRGLIVNYNGTIIARPFHKFFNYSEWERAEEEFPPDEDPLVMEKEDGSLIIVYYYRGEWRTASSGSFNSPHADKAKEILDRDVSMNGLDKRRTYVFEMVSSDPEFQIVKDYDEDKLILLAVRHRFNGEHGWELVQEVAGSMGVDTPETYSINESEALNKADEIDPQDKEGFVLWYPNSGYRAKIKGKKYRELHKALDKGQKIYILEAMDEYGDIDSEQVTHLPEDEVDEIQQKFDELYEDVRHAHQKALEKGTRKEQAQYLDQYREEFEKHAVFALLDGSEEDACGIIKEELRERFEN